MTGNMRPTWIDTGWQRLVDMNQVQLNLQCSSVNQAPLSPKIFSEAHLEEAADLGLN